MTVELVEVRQAQEMAEGAGARVKRLMPVPDFPNFDPFVLWDHFTVGAGAGFPTHPHRGFEAITYMFEGSMRHADNMGNRSTVFAGGAQRFTAGRGLEHSEMPGKSGESSGIQLWINLPHRLKPMDPDYQQVNADAIPEAAIDGGVVRTIVGEGSPLVLQTPVVYLDVRLAAGKSFEYPFLDDFRSLLYVVEGSVDSFGERVDAGSALFAENTGRFSATAGRDARFMCCAGRAHFEPIYQHGPFVD